MSSWLEWFRSANFSIYACHFLAAWSGRMWGFTMGLILITIAPGSLELSAIYGLTMGASVLFFGTVVGDWVDRTPRLRAGMISMVLQNSFVITCACVVFVLLCITTEVSSLDIGVQNVFFALIIGMSVLSRLMKVGRVIVIERDWIVEIARSRNTPLTLMTSTFRRIDLLTKIFAPMICGQITNYAGLRIGCVFIAVWSLLSIGIEYFLIRRVYRMVPALQAKWNNTYDVDEGNVADKELDIVAKQRLSDSANDDNKDESVAVTITDKSQLPKSWSPLRLFASFIIIFQGFRTYVSYDVKWAGFALAALYLTVLGFDGITVGYATTQGLSSSLLGILMGIGASFGILATFTYPSIVRRLGLPRTGVLALALQVSCLSLCVVSVFLPGSPFDLGYTAPETSSIMNCTNGLTESNNSNVLESNSTYNDASQTTPPVPCPMSTNNSSGEMGEEGETRSMVSVYVMMAGIVTARFGLWTADLTIIQLFLERVKTEERGVVNGFQSSLNQLMDFLKYAMVAAIPYSHQFGLLIFTSFSFICFGWLLMFIYALETWRKAKKFYSVREKQRDGNSSRRL